MTRRLILVWNADGGLLGHLRYIARKVTGAGTCALCDLTHDGLNERESFQACKQDLGIPVETVYRDELSGRLASVVDTNVPCVVLEDGERLEVLLSSHEITELDGLPSKLEATLGSKLAQMT